MSKDIINIQKRLELPTDTMDAFHKPISEYYKYLKDMIDYLSDKIQTLPGACWVDTNTEFNALKDVFLWHTSFLHTIDRYINTALVYKWTREDLELLTFRDLRGLVESGVVIPSNTVLKIYYEYADAITDAIRSKGCYKGDEVDIMRLTDLVKYVVTLSTTFNIKYVFDLTTPELITKLMDGVIILNDIAIRFIDKHQDSKQHLAYIVRLRKSIHKHVRFIKDTSL